MVYPLYQEAPDRLSFAADVLSIEPGRVLTARSPFFPGGGGQLADRGAVVVGDAALSVEAIEVVDEGVWHAVSGMPADAPAVELRVDPAFRALQSELHTLAHLVNAIVFRAFDGALLTGAQLNADATLRVDFDLPDVDNDRLRALEGEINAAAAADHEVVASRMDWDEAAAEPGLFRSRSATPPKDADGTVRIVRIGDLDRQACGGTHVASTGQCRPIRIAKIENKGRHNRRVRVALAAP